MRILLDTHALLWWLAGSSRLPKTWRKSLQDGSVPVHVSAASIWEISVKSSIGKLSITMPRKVTLAGLAKACGFADLPIDARHAAAVADLPMHHADPFDRLLIAQAIVEKMTLVTADSAMRVYDVPLLEP